jgi:plastocyanin
MNRGSLPRVVRVALLLGFVALLGPTLALARVQAQEATPVVSSQGITLTASGLLNPRGFVWGLDGTLYVGLAGSGGAGAAASSDSGMAGGSGGLTAGVAWIADGCPEVWQGDLPSSRSASGSVRGVAAVAILDTRLYALISGGGAENGNPNTPNGIYTIDGDGSAGLVADLSAWVRANPVASVPGDATPEGDPFAMIAGDDELWVVEANSGQLLRVTRDGEITRVVDFSTPEHLVPTGLTMAPDGGLYVGFLTPAPYTDGASKVVKVAEDGTVTDVWTGLTTITGLAVGPDGTLYALEMGTGNTTTPPFAQPNTGKVVRQDGPSGLVDIATGLDRPVAMAFGPDGGLYVGFPAFGATGPTGAIVRLDLNQGQTMTMDPALLLTSTCAGAIPTPAASPEVTPDPAAPTPSGAPATPDSSGAGGGDAVSIANFAFGPDTIQVAAGTTVTWTNNDTAAHTVTADDGSFDSGNLAPGDTFTYTFTTAGTVAYHCNYHPNMTASVVVQ